MLLDDSERQPKFQMFFIIHPLSLFGGYSFASTRKWSIRGLHGQKKERVNARAPGIPTFGAEQWLHQGKTQA
jgi:hypothetical protein